MQDSVRDGARRAPQGAGAPAAPAVPATGASGGTTRTPQRAQRGPRALVLRRQENQDFGFTLRHFIVYPPESYTVLGGDRRLHNVAVDEPMDTIFVRLVREHSPAHQAGLCQGDRIVSVNGETIGGKSYAQVVQLIQSSGSYLHLLVVPKEEDLLQQYFGETAHNPETNQRPQRMRSPDVRDRQNSPLSSRPVSGISDLAWSDPYDSGPGTPRRASEGCTQRRELTASARTQFLMGAPAPTAAAALAASLPGGPPLGLGGASLGASSLSASRGVAWESLPPHSRLSLDAGVLEGGTSSSSLPTATSSKDSLLSMDSSSTLQDGCSSDDSVILSRIRRSTEQKEEFLRRPAQPIWPLGDAALPNAQLAQHAQHVQDPQGVIAREFYARPQKLQKSVWPPAMEKEASANSNLGESLESGPGRGTGAGSSSTTTPNFLPGGPVGAATSTSRNNKSYFSTLSRIQENQPSVSLTGSEDTVMNGDSMSLPSSCSSRGAEENQPHLPVIHLVSRRARQFESGEEEDSTDRTSFYRSELARLTAKKGVPEVAVRKREFESRSLQESANARKLDKGSPTSAASLPPSSVSGNRSIPIGSTKLHCDPPPDYKPSPEDLLYNSEPRSQSSSLKMRIRSRSADPTHHDQRNKAVRQESYLNAASPDRKRQAVISTVLEEEREGSDVSPSPAPKILAPDVSYSPPISPPIRPNQLPISNPIRPASHPQRNSIGDPEGLVQGLKGSPTPTECTTVVRRQKDTSAVDEDRSTRRVSYLKATWNDRMHVDSDLELSDTEPAANVVHRRLNRKWRPPLFPDDIQRLKRLFEDAAAAATGHSISHHQGTPGRSDVAAGATTAHAASPPASSNNNKENVMLHREGLLHCKITFIDGKRATDRSWKQVWAVVRGPVLCLYKERAHAAHSHHHHQETPLGSSEAGVGGDHIDLRCSLVEVAADYTKKKHVLRLNSASGSELLLQADTGADLLQWVRVLQDQAGAGDSPEAGAGSSPGLGQGLSPTVAHKGIKKLTSLRNRSPTGQPPLSKTRKPSQPSQGSQQVGVGVPLPLPLPLPSPKSKTWKGRVAKQFRKMQQGGGSNSPSSPTAPHSHPEGVTIGVPLEDCPPSNFSEAVPLLLELCTSIVEARGLEVIGIYRVPGNTAAVSSLTESINKGFDFVNLQQDPRWGDVNVISSLLKSFFRRLPDSLFTTELYPSFIEADKIESPLKRVHAIRKLIRELPEHHYETLRYLLTHLKRVVEHSHTNKMEARNLAIVFGPTLVRAGDDNMVTMVTDMSSQCRIVETLISNVDWFFSEDDSEEFPLRLPEEGNTSANLSSSEASGAVSSAPSQNQSLLLGNIHKVEGLKAESPSKDVSARDIVSSIITAANRKIQRGKTKKSESELGESKQAAEVQRSKTKEQSSLGLHPNTDLSPTAVPINQKRCSLSDVAQISKEPQITSDPKSSSQTAIPATTIPTITTSSPKAPTSVAMRYRSPPGEDFAIMSYANLAQTTQERIKRFEQETKAMLERDLHRQTRDSQQWDEQRRQIERQWLEAKQELEADDALDSVIDHACDKKLNCEKLRGDSIRSLLSSTSSSGSASGSGTPPQRLSWRVGWGSRLSSTSNTSNSASSLVGTSQVPAISNQSDAQSNGHLKRMKTGKEPRSGSLDSLQGVPAGERPHSHMSDEGGDLLASLTSTFDQKLKSLLGTSKATSGTTATTTTSVSQTKTIATETSSSSTKATAAKPTSSSLPSNKTEISNSPSDRLHLLNCDDDIPYADTDVSDLDSQATQPTSLPAIINSPVSPSALLSFRDPSLHRASRILRSSTVPAKPTTSDSKENSENTGPKCSPQRWSTPVNVSDCNFVCESGRTFLEKRMDLNATPKVAVKNVESGPVSDTIISSVKTTVTSGNSSLCGPVNVQCDKLKLSESSKKTDCFQSSTKLKRSESLNKSSDRTDGVLNSKLRRSESLNKNDRSELNVNVKLRRSESLNKNEKSESKLKRSDSLTKTEKTESNMNRRRQQENRANARGSCGGSANIRDKETTKMLIQNATIVLTKLKRKNGMPERSIKRRHTVGGTKDFDKLHWLDNRIQSDQCDSNNSPADLKEKKSLRTSSPDLSSSRLAGILVEVSLLHTSDVHRPHSLPDPNLVSAVFKVPLESHV